MLSLAGSVLATPSGINLVLNGDFETGDLSNWTVFQTDNGVTQEGVESFDTTGSGATYAARFNVGKAISAGSGAGGGIYQSFYAPAGPWEVSTMAVASWDQGTYPNSDGGLFELLVDGTVVDSCDFGNIAAGAIERDTLSATGSFAASGSHEIRIKITRDATTSIETPNQYVDNVNLQVDDFTSSLASIGDYVWEDANSDGIQDAGENGIDGVTVNLYQSNSTLADTTTTAGGGLYSFADQVPGFYYVEFILPTDYSFSPLNQGSDDALDSDADTATGQTAVITLDPDENDLTCDAGMYATPQEEPWPAYSVGGEVQPLSRLNVLFPWLALASVITVLGVLLRSSHCKGS
ncbi:MAG: hypothetical protein JXA46_05845 [Dehalococcoidales bacterium]|nr:hypothetical protein [Dehalococcoidales bacterium]